LEASKVEHRRRIRAHLPDLQRSLEMVQLLVAKAASADTLSVHFNLSDIVFAAAAVTPSDRVGLWVGGGVMLDYSYAEAEALLRAKIADATAKETEVDDDLALVREAAITAEVNLARVFNADVKRTRAEKARTGA
jgi:prefoldin subunit 5